MNNDTVLLVTITAVALIITFGIISWALRHQLVYRCITWIALGWFIAPAGTVAVGKWADIEIAPSGFEAAMVSVVAILTIGAIEITQVIQSNKSVAEPNIKISDQLCRTVQAVNQCMDLNMTAEDTIKEVRCTREQYHQICQLIMMNSKQSRSGDTRPAKEPLIQVGSFDRDESA